jgi:hypothetical protein
MKNTQINKERFFAQYIGQKVLCDKAKNNNIELTKAWNWKNQSFFLRLKSLSNITNEDALEIAKLNRWADYREGNDPEPYITHTKNFIKKPEFQLGSYVDYLRRRGYALDFDGITVDEQIEFGWIKIKEDE